MIEDILATARRLAEALDAEDYPAARDAGRGMRLLQRNDRAGGTGGHHRLLPGQRGGSSWALR